ncbi:MAG TPA: S41 family peptidase [Bryobacteraceae bacterium]|jgi:carboxyl-terminal processing protease
MKSGCALSVLVLASLSLCAQPAPADTIELQLQKITEVFAAIEREAATPVDPNIALYQGAIPGMLRTLDPHSSFFDPDQFQQLQQMERSEQKGFGSIVSVLPGRVIILQTLQGTPSAKAGLSAGDEIVAINNIVLARLEFEQLVGLLGAARQQQVALDVHRPGEGSLLRVTMSPELVNTPSVDRVFDVAPGIGYLRITSFEDPTGKLVKESIDKLGGNGLKGLVLDLRDDPGGSVQSAIETASLFLKSNQLIFSIKGRAAKSEEVRVPKLTVPYSFPMAILVNGKTASASEIVTGALQDHDRAIVLGEPSYGKGLVQQVYNLSSNSGLALTTAFYYTPSGRSIQKPVSEGQLYAATVVDKGPYKTDSGRQVPGGGGIQPDEIVYPEGQTRLRLVLDASATFTNYATEFLRSHDIAEDFQVTSAILDDLQVFANQRRIQPSLGEWSAERSWISSRLQQEIVSLKFGVAKGDEVEMKRDPVVRRALEVMNRP